MIVLEGLPALSPFRLERLEARLRATVPQARIAGAWFTYWVEPDAGATPEARTLQRILQADAGTRPRADGAVSRFVGPRLGTVSPWASKATELLHGAGLPVKRVERGTRIDLLGWPGDAASAAALSGLLHDPMTQSLLGDAAAAAAMFGTPLRPRTDER